MAYGTTIKRGFTLAGKIDKKYNLNKIFIDKYFPPGYRKPAHKIVDIAGALGGGYGLYAFAKGIYDDMTFQPGNNAPFSQQNDGYASYSKNKTRYRQTSRCYPRSTKYNNSYSRKRFSYSR